MANIIIILFVQTRQQKLKTVNNLAQLTKVVVLVV